MTNTRSVPVVYVAGPYRPRIKYDQYEQERNIRTAEALAWQVWKTGCAAICPHANTRFFQGSLPDLIWIEGDLSIVDRCDALITTINWELSDGARCEVARAKLRGIPVFHDIISLQRWVESKQPKDDQEWEDEAK